MNKLEIKYININDIIPYKKNPRINENAIPFVMESIKKFGFKNPVILDKNNVIVCGHTRIKSAEKLGIKEIPCIYADDLTEDQVKAFRLADNKVSEKAEWDFDLLNDELSEILDIDMDFLGFDENVEIDPNNFGTDFELPVGEKNELEQITFTLHSKQAELIKNCLVKVKNDIFETFGNENKNGNAIYEVCRQWEKQKK